MDFDVVQAFQKGLMCVICMNTLIDPVTIECGHSFCWPCLCLTWEVHTPARCPVCREPSQKRDFSTHIILKHLASIARKASFRQFLSLKEHMFKTHKKTKKRFGEVDKNTLCSYQTNRHCLTEWAAEEHWEKILKQMRSVWERIQENQRNINEEGRMINEWIQLKKRKTQMLHKKKYLRKLYKELMEIYQKPDVELLQNVKYIMARCEFMLGCMLKTMKPQLGAYPIPGLIESLNQFRREYLYVGGTDVQSILRSLLWLIFASL